MRIKIATIASRVENVEETKETDTRLEAERSQVVEAAIVRTMKSRKQLTTPELTNEVIAQLTRRFTPKPVTIKMAIEKLIEKEYLERDSKDRKLLRYLVSTLSELVTLERKAMLTYQLLYRRNLAKTGLRLATTSYRLGRGIIHRDIYIGCYLSVVSGSLFRSKFTM